MNINDKSDLYNELYEAARLTVEDLRQFKDLEGLSGDECGAIADGLFSLAILAEKIMVEGND